MPSIERDKNTGALIFHKTPTEKKLEEVEERLNRLEKLENVKEQEEPKVEAKPRKGRKPIKKDGEA